MKRRLSSLRWLIPGTVLIGLAISGFGVNWYLSQKTKELVYSKIDLRLQSIANSFLFTLQAMNNDFFSKENQKTIQRIMENASGSPQMMGVFLVDKDLKVLIDGDRKYSDEPLPQELVPFVKAALQKNGEFQGATYYQETHSFVLVRSIEGGEYNSTTRSSFLASLVLVNDLSLEDQELTEYIKFGTLLQVISIGVLSLLCYWMLLKRVIRPLKGIRDTVRTIETLDFTKQAQVLYKDELGEVAQVLNLMIKRVAETTENLETKVKERTAELLELQKTAVISAHQSGMAEIATGILHNVGNILNSVNVGAENMLHILKESEMSGLLKANELLKKNIDSLADFLLNNPKGKILPQYYLSLGEALDADFKNLNEELSSLLQRIQLIKDVISSQQSYAKGGEFKEEVFVSEVVEAALTMQLNALVRHDVQVTKKYGDVQPIVAQKAKLVHVLLNLIKNAKEAMVAREADIKELTIEVGNQTDKSIFIKISDNGEGIAKENLVKVFNHGFTTKKSGHGFGLHYCANALTEMGGRISVESEGLGKGTTFTILFARRSELQKVG